MRVAPQQIWVFRQNKWQQIMSDEIYPGDVIMLLRDKNKKK
jgi:cation-transporting ATPase 13A1